MSPYSTSGPSAFSIAARGARRSSGRSSVHTEPNAPGPKSPVTFIGAFSLHLGHIRRHRIPFHDSECVGLRTCEALGTDLADLAPPRQCAWVTCKGCQPFLYVRRLTCNTSTSGRPGRSVPHSPAASAISRRSNSSAAAPTRSPAACKCGSALGHCSYYIPPRRTNAIRHLPG
jgi:hypothetical protein